MKTAKIVVGVIAAIIFILPLSNDLKAFRKEDDLESKFYHAVFILIPLVISILCFVSASRTSNRIDEDDDEADDFEDRRPATRRRRRRR